MPKTPTDYSKTIIYKIYCKDETITQNYIGSTTNFTKRKNQHKNICKNENSHEYNTQKYIFIRENGGWDNFIITPIEEYPCENRVQQLIREQYHMDLQTGKLNACNAYTSVEDMKKKRIEYNRNNSQTISAYSKQYRIDNYEKRYLQRRKRIEAKRDVLN